MAEQIKLKIPRGLGLALASDKNARKSVGTWLVLKSASDGGQAGPITTDMAALARCCTKTLAGRIKHLVKLGLAYFDGQDNVRLAAWDKLNQLFKLNGRYRHIPFNENAKCKPEHILMALAIDEKKKECAAAAKYKIDNMLGLKNDLKAILGVKFIEKKMLTECQLLSYFKKGLYDEEDHFVVNAVRMDEEVGYKRWSDIIGYKGRGSFAYLKRKLQSLGLLNITKRQFSDPTTKHRTTIASRKDTNLGSHFFATRQKALNLVLPDLLQVTI